MRQLSSSGQQAIDDIAQRHGFSVDATMSMLDAVINGNGGMAQFSHPEFAGSGQWMRGGMTMVSDMFNNHLKNRVDSLCFDLATLISNQPELIRTGSFQSQRQGGSGGYGQEQTSHSSDNGSSVQNQGSGNGPEPRSGSGSGSFGSASLFVPGTSGDWWPADLRWPNSTGAQNGVRYACFSQARRLAIDVGGTVTVYDTLDHPIGSFSQQQSAGGTLSFSSQHGLIDVASLPVVSSNGNPPRRMDAAGTDQFSSNDSRAITWGHGAPNSSHNPDPGPASNTGTSSHDIFTTIEKLADLKTKGILSQDEFDKKKAELLSRL